MPTPALLGVVLDGKYSVRAIIGQGGMGAVYQAQHLGTGRPVAVKVLLTDLGRSEEALERFRREARAAGRLRHPNIVDVTDFGVARVAGQELPYLVMEFLEGSTLRALIEERGALPLDVVVAIVEQIAVAVEAAHRAGIIHRDLKPDNVWLVNDARGGFAVRVLDFGIARLNGELPIAPAAVVPIHPDAVTVASQDASEAAGGEGDSTEAGDGEATAVRTSERTDSQSTTDRLTIAGSTLGTPLYMSPEQCSGADADERSDIYSLGVMAYEMLSGRRPFSGRFRELVEQHLHASPPGLSNEPPKVAAVVMRALAKNREERYPSAQALAGSLRVAAEGPATIVRRSLALYAERFHEFLRLSARVALPPVVVTLILLLVAGITAILFGPREGAIVVTIATAFAPLGWSVVTIMTNSAFAAAVERLRLRPLESLDATEVIADMRTRVGVPPDAGYVATFVRTAVYYLRCEMSSRAGAGDLAFLIGFLERIPLRDIPPRCALLAVGSRGAYNVVRAGIFAALFLIPVVEAGLIFLFIEGFVRLPRELAMLISVSLLPVNAMLVNPIFSTALALLYFRARQAQGEDVALAAVLPGRV